ncbi:hypothetical protein D0T84_12915 [Dysgonomonas sp. 521]|uniref:hypothetical protein n=1 Tax=Dysgonomonas sp. 521 TaxID=2302932 RepID=UPI0013D47282|nr:hypothetical protein [Dysgonomonas sp. 521]NDV95804.1 hypothetical protein [Dysgonomonas sp. 521]
MKKGILSVIFFIIITGVWAQEYSVPKNYEFSDKDAYAAYEPQIKETIGWLLQSSLGKEAGKRQEANTFLIAWLTGTPNVSVVVDSKIADFIKINPELLIPFMAGWTEYSLNNDYSKDNIRCAKAGLEAVAAFYRKNRGYLKKDGSVEKIEKLIEKGKLEEDIRKKLK